MELKNRIETIWEKENFTRDDRTFFEEFKAGLNNGSIRAAEPIDGKWKVNTWVKKGILLGFKMGKIIEMPLSDHKSFFDKDTYPEKQINLKDGLRLVPGGSSIREGCFVAPSVVMMPPMYINVGAYVDEGSMVDSHALVGTCAQIGKGVHLSASSQIGGVIEPIGANPVIIEDHVFVGGNTGLYEGVIVRKRAIIAAGVIITSGTKVYDSVNKVFLSKNEEGSLEIPEGAVVISG